MEKENGFVERNIGVIMQIISSFRRKPPPVIVIEAGLDALIDMSENSGRGDGEDNIAGFFGYVAGGDLRPEEVQGLRSDSVNRA